MTAISTSSAARARREIKLIQTGRGVLRLDDDTYRQMLARLCSGKTSSKALTPPERQVVLDHMRHSGFVPRARTAEGAAVADAEAGWPQAPKMRKLRAMWYLLAEHGHVVRPADAAACNAAIQQWAQHMVLPGLEALRFASGAQMAQLIEAMKKWLARLGLPDA